MPNPTNDPGSAPPKRQNRPRLCKFHFADGRRCRMPRAKGQHAFCVSHVVEMQRREAEEAAARELAGLAGDFSTPGDVNVALRKLWTLFAKGHVQRRDAVTLAYIGQLLLTSLNQVRRSESIALEETRKMTMQNEVSEIYAALESTS